ncbi:regulatory protein AfsR [Abditibacteriota bacterium]|nr:regulatory protein AfsR [Abditibacteriota bacterium]
MATNHVKILFLAANPNEMAPLALGEEVREIEAKIRAAQHRDNLELIPKGAVRSDDLIQYFNQYPPHIVHFSGYGSPADDIILVDQEGKAKSVSKQALSKLFQVFNNEGNIRLVVLNACFSRPQAEAITERVDCAIGMDKEIDKRAAILFTASFYRAIGFGRSIQGAFDQGILSLQLEGIAESLKPELVVRAGVDPSQIILVNPSLALPPITTPTVTAPTVSASSVNPLLHQLPPPPRDFTGRATELAELLDSINQDGSPIFGIYGMGGVGKTALALVLSQHLVAHYSGAQFYIDLLGAGQSPLSVAEAMGRVIHAYLPTLQLPDDLAVLSGIYQSVLQGQRALLMLDNARDAAQIEPLLPPTSCAVIVTSRQHIQVAGLKHIHLHTLTPPDAHNLLLKIAPRIGKDAAALARRCGYLPLALRLAASFLAGRPNISPQDYLRMLNDMWTRLEMEPVKASLCLSYKQLKAPMRSQWCALNVFPGSFDDAAAAAVWDLKLDMAQDRLSSLLAYSMIEWNEDNGRYWLHDLSRDVAGANLSVVNRATSKQRHAAYYLNLLTEANASYKKGHEAMLQGLKLFDHERPNIEAGHAWAKDCRENNDEAARYSMAYPNAGAHVFILRQTAHERIAWLGISLSVAQYHLDEDQEAQALGNMALAYIDINEIPRAIECLNRCLLLSHKNRNRQQEGYALDYMGWAYSNSLKIHEAIKYYEQALSIFQEIGDQRSEGTTLGKLGVAYAVLNKPDCAIEFYEKGLAIARRVGNWRGEGIALGNLGEAQAQCRNFTRAVELLEQGFAILQEIGDLRGQGFNRDEMSKSLYALGRREEAISSAEAAFEILTQIKDPSAPNVQKRLALWRREIEE